MGVSTQGFQRQRLHLPSQPRVPVHCCLALLQLAGVDRVVDLVLSQAERLAGVLVAHGRALALPLVILAHQQLIHGNGSCSRITAAYLRRGTAKGRREPIARAGLQLAAGQDLPFAPAHPWAESSRL